MALIICTECKKEVSDKATTCIHCGCPLSQPQLSHQPEQYNNYRNPSQQKQHNQPSTPLQQFSKPLGRGVRNFATGFFVLIFALIFVGFILETCSGGSSSSQSTPASNRQSGNTSTTINGNTSTPTSSSRPIPTSEQINIPAGGIVLFNEDGMVVSVVGVNRNRSGLITEIQFEVENNMKEEYNIRNRPNVWSVISVNNLTFQGHLSARVMPGRKSSERIRLDSDEVELFDLRDVYSLTMQFQTDRPNDTFMMKDILVYPPSNVVVAEGEHGNDFLGRGSLVFSSEVADVYSFGIRRNVFLYYADFVVHNKTDRDLRFCFGGLSIDGFMDSGFETSEDVYAGTYRIFSVGLDSSDIREIEFMLREEGFLEIFSSESKDIGLVNVIYD